MSFLRCQDVVRPLIEPVRQVSWSDNIQLTLFVLADGQGPPPLVKTFSFFAVASGGYS